MANKSTVPGALRRRVFREENYTCAKCSVIGREQRFPRGGYGYPTDMPGVFLSIDHIVPRAKGGTGDRKNLRVLCTPCNTEKGIKDA
jgi:5-methylcytosine-specific restriction endonuclease McrA